MGTRSQRWAGAHMSIRAVFAGRHPSGHHNKASLSPLNVEADPEIQESARPGAGADQGLNNKFSLLH